MSVLICLFGVYSSFDCVVHLIYVMRTLSSLLQKVLIEIGSKKFLQLRQKALLRQKNQFI